MIQSEPQKVLTDAIYALKRAFEDKDVQGLRECFRPQARLNVDGKFHSVAQAATFAKILFDAADRTYFDVLEMQKSEAYEQGMFGVFEASVAWVNRSTWRESSQRLTLSLEVTRDEKEERALINGFTAVRQPDVKHSPERDDDGVPVEIGMDQSRTTFDPFSFWY
jgi:hypothetical protein